MTLAGLVSQSATPTSPPGSTSEIASEGVPTVHTSISGAYAMRGTGQSATSSLGASPASPTASGDPLAPTPAAATATDHDQTIVTIDLTRYRGSNDDHRSAPAKMAIFPAPGKGDYGSTPSSPPNPTLAASSACPEGMGDTVCGPEAHSLSPGQQSQFDLTIYHLLSA